MADVTVAGDVGFIGANAVRDVGRLAREIGIVVLDSLSYAGTRHWRWASYDGHVGAMK